MKYYVGLFVVVFSMFLFLLDFWVYFPIISFMIPQIVQTAMVGLRNNFWGGFILGCVLMKPFPIVREFC